GGGGARTVSPRRPTHTPAPPPPLPRPAPPLAEQREIVRRIEGLFGLAARTEERLAAASARVERLPRAILARALAGELVETEAELATAEGRAYEPATELLRRVINSSY